MVLVYSYGREERKYVEPFIVIGNIWWWWLGWW